MTFLVAHLRTGLLAVAGLLALGGIWQGTHSAAAPVHAAAADQVSLPANLCSNLALTWPTGTNVSVVAAAVTPANAVEAIWKQSIVNDRQVFIAWSPLAGAPNDYTSTASSLEAVFICTKAAATLERPS